MTQCVVVLIIDDLVTEDIESFNMTVNTEDPDVRIIGGNTEIRIIDNDGKLTILKFCQNVPVTRHTINNNMSAHTIKPKPYLMTCLL